ncbi:GtrA family protein [Lysinibacillus yapensis]|uniref:GtrA family protein n=2 Tax=Ureibacillus yapensis TaxID=2304605 RepID=A0A396SB99_9BACL|nr:GtrA family protein [Lysinibacillus yapensis]
MKEISLKFMKYSLVGCINTCIYFLCVFLLIEQLHFESLLGSCFSFILMTIASFCQNVRYTFKGLVTQQRLVRFFSVSLIGFMLNFLLIYFVVHVLFFHYMWGELLTILIIPVVNFLLNNYWTFQTN